MHKDGKSYDEIKEELLYDFWSELDKVDFSRYRPDSPEFMYPTTIGMLYLVLDAVDPKNDVTDEIESAEEYLRKYEETKEPAYHTMAGDEVKHAKFLLGKMKQSYPNRDMSDYEKHILEIQSQL